MQGGHIDTGYQYCFGFFLKTYYKIIIKIIKGSAILICSSQLPGAVKFSFQKAKQAETAGFCQ